MEIEKSEVLIQFLLIFRRSEDDLFFLYGRRLRGYTATVTAMLVFERSEVLLFRVAASKTPVIQ